MSATREDRIYILLRMWNPHTLFSTLPFRTLALFRSPSYSISLFPTYHEICVRPSTYPTRSPLKSVAAPKGGGGGGGWRSRSRQDPEDTDDDDAGSQQQQQSGARGGGGGGRGRGRSGSAPGRDGGGAGGRNGDRARGRGGGNSGGRGGRGNTDGGVYGGEGQGGGGGRGPGRGRGGGGGGGGGGRGKDPEKIQQRRKAADKASVGNHNRRNAARKKESKGMF